MKKLCIISVLLTFSALSAYNTEQNRGQMAPTAYQKKSAMLFMGFLFTCCPKVSGKILTDILKNI
jgi:hypothetical protein